MIFFCQNRHFLSIAGPVPNVDQAYTQPYTFGIRIKRIICQIRHELRLPFTKYALVEKKRWMVDPMEEFSERCLKIGRKQAPARRGVKNITCGS